MWNSRRGVWVCNRHPHMQVSPDDFERATMAPKADREPIVYGLAGALAVSPLPFPSSEHVRNRSTEES